MGFDGSTLTWLARVLHGLLPGLLGRWLSRLPGQLAKVLGGKKTLRIHPQNGVS